MAFVLRVAILLTAYHNVLILLPIPRALHVPANLTTAAVLVRASRARGLPDEALGLNRSAVGPGIRWGGALSAAIGAAGVAAVSTPKGANLLRDERAARMHAREVVYRLVVHIPLGTAVPEEILFRGVLYGLWSRDKGRLGAVLASSAAFGLWHVGPAIDRLRANRPDASSRERATAIGGTIAATALAGVLLSLLRIRSRGLVAPVIVHWGSNAVGTIAAVSATK